MGETYETTGFTHVMTVDYSQNYMELGLEPNTKEVIFEYMTFYYSARCWNDIIQYIECQYPFQLGSGGVSPTDDEFEILNLNEELFNGNHQPLQDWIDNLSI